MKPKTELWPWQEAHLKEKGLLLLPVQLGQVRRYGPTFHEYEVVDVYNQYTNDEVLQIVAGIEHARIPEKIMDQNYPPLEETVLVFKQLSPHCYLFKSGHDYTD